MNDKDINVFNRRTLGRRLAMLYRLSQAWLAGPLAEIGVTRGGIGFLLAVFRSEGISQEELTRELFIDRAATARAVQSLEDAGLVRREADPRDRRRKRVYSTDAARALQPGLIAMLDAHNEALLAGMSRNERERVMDALDRLVDNLRDAVEGVER